MEGGRTVGVRGAHRTAAQARRRTRFRRGPWSTRRVRCWASPGRSRGRASGGRRARSRSGGGRQGALGQGVRHRRRAHHPGAGARGRLGCRRRGQTRQRALHRRDPTPRHGTGRGLHLSPPRPRPRTATASLSDGFRKAASRFMAATPRVSGSDPTASGRAGPGLTLPVPLGGDVRAPDTRYREVRVPRLIGLMAVDDGDNGRRARCAARRARPARLPSHRRRLRPTPIPAARLRGAARGRGHRRGSTSVTRRAARVCGSRDCRVRRRAACAASSTSPGTRSRCSGGGSRSPEPGAAARPESASADACPEEGQAAPARGTAPAQDASGGLEASVQGHHAACQVPPGHLRPAGLAQLSASSGWFGQARMDSAR